MLRSSLLAAGLLALAATAHADDAITPEIVRAVKGASAYIDVEGEGWSSSGSGFVVAVDQGAVLVVTNHHVAVKRPPGVRSTKSPALKVILDSGTRTERSYAAEVVAADADRDLAVLKLAGVKEAPRPIAYATPPQAFETMTVYTFGFPLGQDLANGRGYPAVTVGKASVSSLRNDANGELDTIQIDGNLNPGNSGGPVVDGQGRLVGVAVARAREGQGIGFIIPAAEVVRTMEGRIGRVRLVPPRTDIAGKTTLRVEADVIDPAGALRGATAYYVIVPPKGKRPEAASLERYPGSRKLPLKIEKDVASAELAIDKSEGEVVLQVIAERGAGKSAAATRVRTFSLAPAPKPEDLAGPPPAGWKDFMPKDRSFAVWLPEKPVEQEQKDRNVTVDGQVMRISSVVGKSADGLAYNAEFVVLPRALARVTPVKLHQLLRAVLLNEGKGRFTESTATQSGSLSGVQYRIEFGDDIARARVFIARGGVVRMIWVMGSADQVTSVEAETILMSFRLPGDNLTAKAPVPMPPDGIRRPAPRPPAARTPQAPVYRGEVPVILGTIRDPLFKTVGPADAILIGVEARFEKFGQHDIVRGVRPIYRVKGKEELGEQFGNNLEDSVTLKAKDGYAVGAISGKANWWCHGFSLTFMKVKADGTLDPKDSYESEWAGWNGEMEIQKITGEGKPVVGIVGKIVGTKTTALGLLFKGQEGFDPEAEQRRQNTRVIPIGKEPTIVAGGRNPVFKELAPEGGLLVGMEFAIGKFFDSDVTKTVRPIYRVGEKEVFGESRGTSRDRLTTLKAKPGYAVGALSCMSGLNFDGVSLTFMKVKADGTLDPKDSYESEWIGWTGHKPVTKLGGDGTPVVGVVGRSNGTDLNGFGLLFKGQESYEPPAR